MTICKRGREEGLRGNEAHAYSVDIINPPPWGSYYIMGSYYLDTTPCWEPGRVQDVHMHYPLARRLLNIKSHDKAALQQLIFMIRVTKLDVLIYLAATKLHNLAEIMQTKLLVAFGGAIRRLLFAASTTTEFRCKHNY